MRIVDIRERPVRISRYRDPHIPSGDLTPASCPLSPTWPEPDGRWSATASPRSGALSEEIRHFADLGFTHMKIKIGGAPLDHDLRRIEAAAVHLAGSGHLRRGFMPALVSHDGWSAGLASIRAVPSGVRVCSTALR